MCPPTLVRQRTYGHSGGLLSWITVQRCGDFLRALVPRALVIVVTAVFRQVICRPWLPRHLDGSLAKTRWANARIGGTGDLLKLAIVRQALNLGRETKHHDSNRRRRR